MNDLDETVERLRSALDELVADAPAAPNALVPVDPVPGPAGRGHRRSRRTAATVSVAMVVAVVLGVGLAFGPRSGSPSAVGPKPTTPLPAHGAPPGWIDLPRLLPTGVDRAVVATGPVPVPSTGIYEQAYQGTQTTDPPLLLITTVQAQPGALANYAAGSQTVTVDGTSAYLTGTRHEQLLWQTGDGVVVSLEAGNMTAADLVTAAQLVQPQPAAQLGVTLHGSLPDGLIATGEGYAGGDTSQTQGDSLFFANGDCHAYTQVWAGSPADFAALGIIATGTQVTSVRGSPALLAQIDTDTWALVWSPEPGIDVRLQGTNCDLTATAADLTTVDQTTWEAEMTSLGSKAQYFTPEPPTVPAGLPGPGTYGLVH
jgi:hypothetical protein